MKIMRNVQKKQLFLRFMISYILVLSIPLSVTLLVYQQSVGIVKKDALQANLSLLEQSKYIMDRGLNQVHSLSMQLSLDSKLKGLMYEKGTLTGEKVNTLYEVWQDLPNVALTGGLVKKFFVFFSGTGTVLAPDSTYRLSDFYGWIYRYGNMDYETWERLFLQEYHDKEIFTSTPAYVDNGTSRVIAYVQSLPMEVSKQPLGTVMILIDEEEVLKSLGRISTKSGGNVYIVDEKGKIITSKNGFMDEIPQDILETKSTGYTERKVNGKDLLYSYTTSKDYGWTFVAVLPSSTVLDKVDYIRNITIAAILLCFVIGTIVAYFMSYRNIKPIKEVIKILSTRMSGSHPEVADEYNYLCSAVSKLVENDIELSNRLEENLPLAQAVFLQRLIKGELTSTEELVSTMQQVRLNVTGNRFNVLVAHIKGYYGLFSKDTLQELHVIKEILKNFDGDYPIEAYPIDIDESVVAFIMAFPFAEEERCKRELQRMVRDMSDSLTIDYGIQISFGGGSFYNDLSDIYYSFSEARHALEYKKAGYLHKISWYSDIDHEEWVYYYPIDLEQRLINLVKAGNASETEKILDIIYRENFQKYNISSDMVNNLYSEMRGTIYKVLSQVSIVESEGLYDIYDILKKMKHSNTVEDAYEAVKNAYVAICRIVDSRKHSQNTRLKEDVVRFLDENYMRQDVCLAFVAAQFDMSEVYLSNFFKEQVGENFSEYVERLRIQTASELLTQSKISIEDIAARVGYNSSHAFRRAFKRCKGILPTELRKNQ